MRVILTALGLALSALVAGLPAQAAPEARVAGPSGQGLAHVAILDVVMLVDESGSETKQKVAQEKATAGQIVQSLLNSRSRVTVIGFGGVNHVAPNQNPVDVVCPPTITNTPQHLSFLATCVNGLHRRTEQQGDDTDYAQALNEAMNYLAPASVATPPSPPGSIKVILMMTDGAVDVSRNTQQYGRQWQVGEQAAVNSELQQAQQAKVQVWPLGFGNDYGTGITRTTALSYLNNMAMQGAPAVCGQKNAASQPHAEWVNNIGDAYNAVAKIYAASGCLAENGTHTSLPAGGSRTLKVNIPEIASAAAISVRRPNPLDTVTFSRPDGAPWTNTSAISGTDSKSGVETLHVNSISKQDVGIWHIAMTAPKGLTSQLVSATVFWQGAVRAIINATPNVNPGKPISVMLSVLGPNGEISDPATLKDLTVGVTVTGDGLAHPERIKVTPETGANDAGIYTGTYTAPNQRGSLTITGTAAGYGLYANDVPQTVTVGAGVTHFTAVPQFRQTDTVYTGRTITGDVIFSNNTGAAKQVRLVLMPGLAHAKVTSPAGPITVSSGSPPSVPFTVTVAGNSPTGLTDFVIEAVDPVTGKIYDSSAPLPVTVKNPPGFFQKYFWYFIGGLILILLIVAFFFWRRARHRAKINVQDLVVTLRRGGEQKGRELPAQPKWSEVLTFIIRDEETPDPRLDYPPRDWAGPVYLVRRSTPGLVTLYAPTRPKPYEVEVSGPGAALDSGLELSFRDKRPHHHVPLPPVTDPWGNDLASPSPYQPSSGYDPASPTVVRQPENDPWL